MLAILLAHTLYDALIIGISKLDDYLLLPINLQEEKYSSWGDKTGLFLHRLKPVYKDSYLPNSFMNILQRQKDHESLILTVRFSPWDEQISHDDDEIPHREKKKGSYGEAGQNKIISSRWDISSSPGETLFFSRWGISSSPWEISSSHGENLTVRTRDSWSFCRCGMFMWISSKKLESLSRI